MASVNELIKKWKIELHGEDKLRMSGKKNPSATEMEELKTKKPEIMAELRRRDEEKRQAWEIKKAELDAERERKTKEYLETHKLHRCLIYEQDEYLKVSYYIRSLIYHEGRAFTPEYGEVKHVELAHVTPLMESIMDAGGNRYYGIQAAAWEITPEQEAQIMTELAPIAEQSRIEAQKKHREEEEKRVAREAKEREEIAEKERETTRIVNTTKPHQGAKETCSYCGKPNARWRRETAAGIKYACEEVPGMVYAAAPSAEQAEGCLARLMREHEAWAKREGLARCWECGMYRKPSDLDENGYCGC